MRCFMLDAVFCADSRERQRRILTIMKKRRVLAVLLMISETVILFLMHRGSVVSKIVSFRRYAFMYLMLGVIFGRFKCNTSLIWDEARRVILCNISFFLATNVMNSLNMWSVPYILWNALTTAVVSFMSMVFNRYYRIWFRKWLAQNVLVVGTGTHTDELLSVYALNRFALSRIVGVVNCNHSRMIPGDFTQPVLPFEQEIIPFDALEDYLKVHKVDEVVIALPDATRQQMRAVYNVVNEYVSVVKFMPQVNGIVTYQSLVEDFDGVILISSAAGRMHQDVLGLALKRMLDILGGLAGALILLPASLIIKIQFLLSGDHNSIFFTQERIGYRGKTFRMLKFRSMVPNAEEVLEQLMQENPEIRREYEENKKLEHDPRITKVGERIRKSSVDELPQLLNVLIGDMSLVGPRPYLPREKKDMGKYYESVIACRPGLTGMWQTHGRSDTPFAQRLRFDDYYYRNWSIWLDFTILMKTFRAVNTSAGAI